MEEARIPVLGEKFPEVEVKTTHGIIKLPDHYKGKWFVLFSHPADFTPVCTTEFVEFAKNYEKFKELNTELIGLSIDQVFSHIKWMEWIKEKIGVEIPFPIIADDQGELAKKLGMISPYKGTNTVRAVFIVDPNGVIRAILYYPQETGRNITEILRLVKALQTADKHGVATPANWAVDQFEWKSGSLVGNNVIIPPASSLEEKKDREERAKRGEIKCFDWWFCYKPL
ncbi:MAG TPA: peroxiredoxin [Candidatus Nanopusillus sp.]|nr:peroxiredoxin [Candidatus Nanopusillus sp.]